MPVLWMPKGVSTRLEKIRRDFLWGSNASERKIHLINWKQVCLSKAKGGLDIRSLVLMNKALLSKWAWRFAKEDNSTWEIFINLKYRAKEGGWFSRTPRGNARTSLWKGINAEATKLKQDFVFELGEGKRIRLWEDVWCGEVSLCASFGFPALYNIARTKGAKVVEVWESLREDGAWNLRFSRAFNDWELEQVQNFIRLTNNKLIIQRKKDRIVWKGNKNGQFLVKVYCSLLEVGPPLKAPTNIIWNPYVPTKVGLFTWEA